MMSHKEKNQSSLVITSGELLEHWQGHRRLTRNVIEAFPEDKLFGYSIGGMRFFADMARELIGLAGRGIHGIAAGNWEAREELYFHSEDAAISEVETKKELLQIWDSVTKDINKTWPQIPEGRFRETDTAWGLYKGPVWSHIFYFIDNENHHRGQGYVYLRSLDIEPPYFWERQ